MGSQQVRSSRTNGLEMDKISFFAKKKICRQITVMFPNYSSRIVMDIWFDDYITPTSDDVASHKKNHKQYSHYLVIKSGTINSSPGQATEPDFKQEKIKENHNISSRLPPNLYDENIWHINITRSIIFQFSIHIASFVDVILVKFYFSQAHLYPILRPNQSFQRWPPDIVSIFNGPYSHLSVIKILQTYGKECVLCFDLVVENWYYVKSTFVQTPGMTISSIK